MSSYHSVMILQAQIWYVSIIWYFTEGFPYQVPEDDTHPHASRYAGRRGFHSTRDHVARAERVLFSCPIVLCEIVFTLSLTQVWIGRSPWQLGSRWLHCTGPRLRATAAWSGLLKVCYLAVKLCASVDRAPWRWLRWEDPQLRARGLHTRY